jgi:prepilin-type processing-associated H-X9-DG protein
MNYPFPGPQPDPEYGLPVFWVMHVTLLLLALVSLGSLLLSVRHAPRWWEPLVWLATIIGSIVFSSWLARVEGGSHFAVGYIAFVSLIGIIGLIIWVVRKIVGAHVTARITTVVLCLLAMGCVVGMLLPATPSVREAARRTECGNRIRQLALAMHSHHDNARRLPDTSIENEGNPPLSWRVDLLPYLEASALREKYDVRHPWDSSANTPVAKTLVSNFQCPSSWHLQDDQDRFYTHVSAVTGPKTCFENGKGIALDDIADGTSNTILLVEAAGQLIVWTEPRDIDISKDPIGFNLPGDRPHASPGWGSTYHNAGVNIVYADGSVQIGRASCRERV